MITQSIINLISYYSEGYVILSNHQINFLREGDNAAFCPLFFCVLFIHRVV